MVFGEGLKKRSVSYLLRFFQLCVFRPPVLLEVIPCTLQVSKSTVCIQRQRLFFLIFDLEFQFVEESERGSQGEASD